MLINFARTVILYIVIIASMRILGKRQIGELQPAELVITILLSEILAIPMQDTSLPLMNTIIPVLLLVGFEIIISILNLKSVKFRSAMQGNPLIVIREGVIDQKQLKELRFTTDDLLEELRKKDIFDVSQVWYAIVETDGTLSVMLKADEENIKIKDDTEHEIDTTDKTDDLNTQEKTIVDLIQTISINSKNSKDDLLQDLISNNENTVVMAPINEDTNKEALKEELENMTQDLERIKQPLNDLTQDLILEKEKLKDLSMLTDKIDEEENEEENDSNTTTSQIEKSFFTNSTSFSKKDFEGFEDLEKDMKKSSAFTKIAIFLIILMLLGTIFIILNYVLDLKIL